MKDSQASVLSGNLRPGFFKKSAAPFASESVMLKIKKTEKKHSKVCTIKKIISIFVKC